MGKDYSDYKNFIFVCTGKDCKKKGSKDLLKHFNKEIKAKDAKSKTKVLKMTCTGRCKEAANVIVNGEWHTKVKDSQVKKIMKSIG
ncbi:MAG: (2Fe-2S) ferredoxin domain-containing protein [Bacteroidota bacterium]